MGQRRPSSSRRRPWKEPAASIQILVYSPRAAEMQRPPSMNTGPAGPSSGRRMRGLGNQSSRNSVRCMASVEVGEDLVEGALHALEILLVLDEHGQGVLDQRPS